MMQFTHTDTHIKKNQTEHLPNPATKPDPTVAVPIIVVVLVVFTRSV